MYASIYRYQKTEPGADWPRAFRSLSSQIGKLPGFITYLVLEQPDGICLAVSIFERLDDLAGADSAIAEWFASTEDALRRSQPEIATGEVIVQRGL